MSVLIKGMDKPKCCSVCPCYQFDYDRWDRVYHYCGIDTEAKQYPIIELPTPHGRLIDADKLLESFREALDEDRHFVNFFALVDDSPTIIEAEVSEE